MKSNIRLALKKTPSFIILIILLQACWLPYEPYSEHIENTDYKPIFMTRIGMDSIIKFTGPVEMQNPGKFYTKDQFIYINELNKGIHVIDNSNPENPVNTGFINVPGNIDIAMKNNILYLDNSVDLIAVRFDGSTAIVTERINNTFPETSPPGYDYVPWTEEVSKRVSRDSIIVGWEKRIK